MVNVVFIFSFNQQKYNIDVQLEEPIYKAIYKLKKKYSELKDINIKGIAVKGKSEKLERNYISLEIDDEDQILVQCDKISYIKTDNQPTKRYTGELKFDFGHYKGEILDGKMDGFGELYYSNGNSYKGCFISDKKNGFGIFVSKNNFDEKSYLKEYSDTTYDYSSFVYEGNFVDDKFDGEGKIELDEGKVILNGIFKNGYFNIGTETNNEFDRYSEELWEDGKPTGKVKINWLSGAYGGDTYHGEWENHEISGKGKYTYKNGDIYEGEFEKGRRSGNGIYKYNNGDIYDGQWKNNKKHNLGKFYSKKNGKWSSGTWKEGELIAYNNNNIETKL